MTWPTPDTDWTMTCKAGQTTACYSGPAGTAGNGICKEGTSACKADGSGYENLILAGDWTKTDWNVGCIEAAVTSGINAAAALEGKPGS